MNADLSVGMISGFCSLTIRVEGVRLHSRIGGDHGDQPVILWHGFLSTRYAWREVAPALAHAGMSIMIPAATATATSRPAMTRVRLARNAARSPARSASAAASRSYSRPMTRGRSLR
jgi:hypothetical protein